MCLWNLACIGDNRVEIQEEKGIPLLVKLLRHPTPKVRKVVTLPLPIPALLPPGALAVLRGGRFYIPVSSRVL